MSQGFSLFFTALKSSFSRWRDALALTTLWVLALGVVFLTWLQPLWHSYQHMAQQQQKDQQQYQELQLLTAFLPPEPQGVKSTFPTLAPKHPDPPVLAAINSTTHRFTKVSGGCGALHHGFTLGWQECQWAFTGNKVTTATFMNQLAQQPAWIMTQARVMPQGKEWKLSIAGIALSTLP
ncbi:MAG: hypothetical protein QE263_07185 [Vampirovibrionales bacterium]|nr:hypothetical protein [Vampirovibrionales bacterium]